MKKICMDKFLADEQLTIIDAMQKIDLNAKGILFVVDTGNKLVGTVTDGDIRRAIVKTGDLNLQVADVMNRSPKAVRQGEKLDAIDLIRKFQLAAVAVVDDGGKLTDIIFNQNEDVKILKNNKTTLQGIPVVIMAGGKGTRLYPFTKILPKPLIPVGDVTIIERIIERFSNYGIDSYYMTVNYRKNMIKSYLTDQLEKKINFIEEEKPLGTAGSLKLFADQLSHPFFVINCDILIQADYAELYRYHMDAGNVITIVSALKNIEVPYGVIQTKENGYVTALEEKPRLSYFINTGMYILNPECIAAIPEDTFFHMTDLIDAMLKENKKIGMYPVSEDSFLDMGEWEELQRMEKKLKLNPEQGAAWQWKILY